MFERTTGRGRSATRAAIAAVAIVVALQGCGGGGAGAGGSLGATASATDAASIQVLKSVPTLASADGSVVTLTAIVKSAGNVALKDQTVSFATPDAGVRLEVVQAKTDGSGASSAKLTLNDSTNRTVPVTIRSGNVTVVENVVVAGTSVTIVGPSTVALGQTAEFSVTVRDSASNPISGTPVAVASTNGNTVTGAGSTNAQGQLRLIVTGTRSGADTLKVTALGEEKPASFTVSGDQLSFIGLPSEAVVNVAQAGQIKLVQNGTPLANQSITLNATRGTLSSTALTTDSAGIASFTVTSPTAGQTEISASGPGGLVATSRFEFVSTTPTKVKLQASPVVVGANVVSTSSNSSQLIAVVRDAADNPVKNRRVSFSLVADPSNGRIEPGSAVTDSTGTATVAFIAGPTPTGNGAVQVRSTVDGTGIVDNTFLTVSRRELFVRIGTGNEIEKVDTTKNAVPYTVIVSDSSGNPVKDVLVQASVEPLEYFKGSYGIVGTGWAKTSNVACANEDTNGNGQLDPGEDAPGNGIGNGNGSLTPGNPTVATFVGGNRTGDSGYVDLKIVYPRDQSTWLRVRLRVTAAVVAGTEGAAEATFVLPGIAADYTSITVAPPGASSPYGTNASCTIPN